MHKVLTINLNGNAYQLEEEGYAVLEKYLREANERLANDPDKSEIMADLEQAIAEKCSGFLTPSKNVVTTEEVNRIISEMGPVAAASDEAGGKSDAAPDATKDAQAPKRLYRIRDGAMLAGVCTGLAAYFNVDVVIIRLLFVGLTLLTHGPWVIVYLILALVVPYANTTEERAAAHGMPFNTREIIERAKAVGKESIENGKAWHKMWQEKAQSYHDAHLSAIKRSQEKRQARQAARDERRGRRWENKIRAQQMRADVEYQTHIWTHSSLPFLGVIGAALSIAWIVAAVQLVTSRSVFGYAMPGDMPLWVGLLALLILYNFVVWPIRAARYSAYRHAWRTHELEDFGWNGVLGGMTWLAVWAICGWIAYTYVPTFHAFVDRLPAAGQSFIEALKRK